MKATLKNIAKNLKKSSKVHAKQSKQIENIMKKSPAKKNYSKKAKNLLKVVPNKAAYDKLSTRNKIAFDKAAKQAGLPTKKASTMRKDVPTERQANMRAERKANEAGSKLRPNDPLRTKLFDKADKLSMERTKRNKAGDPMKMKNRNVASALKMKKSPALAKLSASCKAAAKRKFKVYPSAYANMWAAKTQRQGKC